MDDTDGKILPYVNDWKWFGLIIQCIWCLMFLTPNTCNTLSNTQYI
jgi:hypothetical protein